ncbi:hypothetical protein BDQ17DRAFT_1356608 [Cyathus striatus]|nr:hypothetical protein BDQ17DRAFT_1356608 [Cyathus striatus]
MFAYSSTQLGYNPLSSMSSIPSESDATDSTCHTDDEASSINSSSTALVNRNVKRLAGVSRTSSRRPYFFGMKTPIFRTINLNPWGFLNRVRTTGQILQSLDIDFLKMAGLLEEMKNTYAQNRIGNQNVISDLEEGYNVTKQYHNVLRTRLESPTKSIHPTRKAIYNHVDATSALKNRVIRASAEIIEKRAGIVKEVSGNEIPRKFRWDEPSYSRNMEAGHRWHGYPKDDV